MTQIDSSTFTVKPNENVTITVEAIGPGTGDFASLSLDGNPLAHISYPPAVYKFKASSTVGYQHQLTFAALFGPEAVDDNSRYELYAQGDASGPKFSGPWYSFSDLGSVFNLTFTVVA